MKYVLVLAVVGVLLWLMVGRQRRVGGGGAKAGAARPAAPVEVVECAHCKVHLPKDEARFDAAGRPYCGDAHRLAGPR